MKPTSGRFPYIGIFILSMGTLVHELLLTRIFSVTMWYHFAFMAISIAMFGLTAGAVAVYRFQKFFDRDPLHYFSLSAIASSLLIVLSFFFHLSIPFLAPKDLVAAVSLGLTFSIIALPFVASGIGITLALTRFGLSVGKIYAADLVGAAVGCLIFFLLLSYADGPSAVLINAGILGLAGLRLERHKSYRVLPLLILLFGVANAVTFSSGSPLLRLVWIKGGLDPKPLYEQWNSYSRIAVYDDPLIKKKPFGWGLSSRTVLEDSVPQQLLLNIDAGAGTVLTAFDGDLRKVSYLKYDLTNLAHYLRPQADVLALGAGGGRDLLSALVFGQKSATGVEINQTIVDVLDNKFSEFTGKLSRYPNVKLINQEARNYIAQSSSKYDIIQVSLIDTWAATAAGAFALSENALYTQEAWVEFIEHLTPGGVLTFSRWWVVNNPAEIYRMVSLASSALRASGIDDPRSHIMLVRNDFPSSGGPDGIGTILVSNKPFTASDVRSTQSLCDSMNFVFALSPETAIDPNLAKLTATDGPSMLSADLGLKLEAPTDDNPFFFHVVNISSIFSNKLLDQGGVSFNMKAVLILLVSMVIVTLLTIVFIILPLRSSGMEPLGKQGKMYLLYFAAIGLAFMLVEISQIQSLNIYLGHPVLSLTIALFAILVSSGVGSFFAEGKRLDQKTKLLLIPTVALVVGFATPFILDATHASGLAVRILFSVGLLFPLGFFMGMAFPIGMTRVLGSSMGKFSPWFWGVNGATSVCGSVLAMLLSLSWGISITYFTGVGLYLLVVVLYSSLSKQVRTS